MSDNTESKDNSTTNTPYFKSYSNFGTHYNSKLRFSHSFKVVGIETEDPKLKNVQHLTSTSENEFLRALQQLVVTPV